MRMKLNLKAAIPVAAALLLLVAGVFIYEGFDPGNSDELEGTVEAVLTTAPNVPPPITRDHPSKVIVHLFTKETVGRLADGVQYPFWTFNGTVPGPMVRVRQGDLVEIHLSNDPSDMMAHNIDIHAVIGPGGGAVSSETMPGHTSVFSFRALHPGLFIYHCATQPVPMHIANGMYGLMLVQPKDGFPRVDKEYYIMQSEFYTRGSYGDPGLQKFDLQKALEEDPTYVVFNGSVGALTGQNAITAQEGQKIRLYVGNIGPNLISSFHIIGEMFDNVYGEGGSTVTAHDIQTTLIPAGGAAIVEFKTEVPGTYTIVDHSIFRAFNKGASGQLIVSGPPNPYVYSGKQSDAIYFGESSSGAGFGQTDSSAVTPEIDGEQPSEAARHETTSSQYASVPAARETGESIFGRTCIACHQADAKGIPGTFPPLSGSDFLRNNKYKAIEFVMRGHSGELTVNGRSFNNTMPPQPLSDEQIATVLTYVRTHFGNSMSPVTTQEVARVRAGKMLTSRVVKQGRHE